MRTGQKPETRRHNEYGVSVTGIEQDVDRAMAALNSVSKLRTACSLGARMLEVEERSWKERGDPGKAEAIRNAINHINAAINQSGGAA